jgi:hypothetical protein
MVNRSDRATNGSTDLTEIFPKDEGRTETLGLNVPPSVAAAIRRTGNRRSSISTELLRIIDLGKLRALLAEDAAHMAKCDSANEAGANK